MQKPIKPSELAFQLKKAINNKILTKKIEYFENGNLNIRKELIGKSKALEIFYKKLNRMQKIRLPNILLTGESGTGKSLIANIIHKEGLNKNGLFVEINCATLPYNLIEAELFGYEKGAFTDAKQAKKGLLETANKGTLFLDEIGELALSLQAKPLQVLENGKFRRIGGLSNLKLDATIIATTNKDLKKSVEEGCFREDLFHRLSVVPINIPSLRERKSDISMLSKHFIKVFNKKFSKNINGISNDALNALENYNWPGNIRELRNIFEKIIILEKDEELIDLNNLAKEIATEILIANIDNILFENKNFILQKDSINLEKLENDLLTQAFKIANENYSNAAQLLKMSRFTFRYRFNKLIEKNSKIANS